MSKQLGPLDYECDAPPYCVVRATREVGILNPEDVRWAQLSRHALQWAAGPRARAGVRRLACVCGQPLPALRKVTFAFDTGASVTCLLGQCGLCRAVFWEETGPRRGEEP